MALVPAQDPMGPGFFIFFGGDDIIIPDIIVIFELGIVLSVEIELEI